MDAKEHRIKKLMQSAKRRAKVNQIPFDLTFEYLELIAYEYCPALNIKLNWKSADKTAKSNSPSLDKINPELGYVKGNVQWLSFKANVMKNNASQKELKLFANWILGKNKIPSLH